MPKPDPQILKVNRTVIRKIVVSSSTSLALLTPPISACREPALFYRRESVGLKAEIRCYLIHTFMYKYKLINIETWGFMVNMLINRSGDLPGSNGPLTRDLQKSRNWLRSLLLVSLMSVGAVGHAATIHDAVKSGDLEKVQRLIDEKYETSPA